MTDDAAAPDDAFATRLAALDDALAAGRPAECDDDLSPELQARLRRGLAALQALRRDRAQPSTVNLRRSDTRPAAGPGPVPLKLGRFLIARELGRGGFGIVFLAHDPQLGRDVALKLPHAQALVDPALRERFRREARAAAGLDHPNIVPVYEVVEDGPVSAIAYAYCSGVTLAEWLTQQQAAVPPADAAALVAALADAAEHAHSRGVVHRDLKPANVLLQIADGQWPIEDREPETSRHLQSAIPYVTDFGLARIAEDGETVTRTGAVMGTPAYMAPEQARGRSELVGPATDVWALGAILYELLTGRAPFRGESDLDTLKDVTDGEPVNPRQLRPRLPRDLETICLKCLRKELTQRYQSAAALRDDLRRFICGEPVQARPVGRAARLARWCRRHPAIAALSAALAAAVLIGAAGIAGAWARANRERDAALAERERAGRMLGHAHKTLARMHDVGESLRQRSATQRRGQEILQEVVGYYQTLLAETGDDPTLHRDAARAARSAGTILRLLSRYGEAEAAYRQGLDLYERLIAADPADPEMVRGRLQCIYSLGTLYHDAEKYDRAIEQYTEAERGFAALAAGPAATPEDRRLHAEMWLCRGSSTRRLNGPAAAVAPLTRALEEFRALHAAAAADADAAGGVGKALEALANCALEGHRYADAEPFTREMVELYSALRASAGEQRDVSVDIGLAGACSQLGHILQRTGRLDEADQALQQAEPVYKYLLRNWPNKVHVYIEYRAYVVVVANVQAARGHWSAAREQYRKAIATNEHLVKIQPANPRWPQDLAWSHAYVARACGQLGEEALAREHLAKARQILKDIPPPPPARAARYASLVAELDRLEADPKSVPTTRAD